MTDQAAIKGTYSDLKFIKTRKVAQVVIEVPIEQAGAFVRAFGTPQPDQETWVAIARLGEAVKDEKPKQRSLAQRAGILCNDTLFHTFLKHERYANWNPAARCADEYSVIAAKTVRDICVVESRSEIDKREDAARTFEALLGEFEAWKRCIEPAA